MRNEDEREKEDDAQAFLDFLTSYVQAVSILTIGSVPVLSEGNFGSYEKEIINIHLMNRREMKAV